MQKVLSTIFSKKIKKFSTFFELFFIAHRHITVCSFFSKKTVKKDPVFFYLLLKIKKRLLTFNNLFQSHLTFFAGKNVQALHHILCQNLKFFQISSYCAAYYLLRCFDLQRYRCRNLDTL